jgi:hypothetical protein
VVEGAVAPPRIQQRVSATAKSAPRSRPSRRLEFIRQVTRFQDARSGRLLEPPLRTMERVRRSDSPYPQTARLPGFRIYKLAGGRPTPGA